MENITNKESVEKEDVESKEEKKMKKKRRGAKLTSRTACPSMHSVSACRGS